MADNETKSVVPKKRTTRKVAKTTAKGTVVNCLALNVREEPSMMAKVVTTIASGAAVSINLADSTPDFYKVDNGYCRKEYVEVK